jgi:PAS domain-containing protein
MTVDAEHLLLIEGNPAASVLLQGDVWPLAGRVAEHQFDAQSRAAVHALLAQARGATRPAEIQARLAGSHLAVKLLALPLQTPDGLRVLLRARPIEPIVSDALPLEAALSRLVDGTRDGILVTDARGLVLGANRALVRLAQAADEDGIRGRPLAEWLGRVESDVAQVVQAVRERGMVQGMRLQIRDAGQQAQVVDVMGMLLIEDQQECLGFVMRPVQALQADVQADALVSGTLAMGQALEAVALDLGRRPLSDLLHSAERLARRHLVQRALDITATDAAAATMLNIDVAQLTRMAADLGAARATGAEGAKGLG